MYSVAKKNIKPRNFIPTVKHGDDCVFAWRCISAAGISNLHIIDGIMNPM